MDQDVRRHAKLPIFALAAASIALIRGATPGGTLAAATCLATLFHP